MELTLKASETYFSQLPGHPDVFCPSPTCYAPISHDFTQSRASSTVHLPACGSSAVPASPCEGVKLLDIAAPTG